MRMEEHKVKKENSTLYMKLINMMLRHGILIFSVQTTLSSWNSSKSYKLPSSVLNTFSWTHQPDKDRGVLSLQLSGVKINLD